MPRFSFTKPALLLAVAILTGAWTFELFDKPGSEQLNLGLQARDSGDSEVAMKSFEQALEEAYDYQTRAKAMMQIASLYLAEEPVSPELAEKAKDMLLQAEELGYPRASLVLGDMYRLGQGVPVDYTMAFQYYNKVSATYPDALISMAEMVTDPQLARDYIAQANENLQREIIPSVSAAARLGRHFRDGRLVIANPELAEYWYKQAAAGGSAGAMMELAGLWQQNHHEPYSDITDLWRQASDLNVDRASLELGFAYASGEGVERDKAMAEQYFAKAVEASPENAYRIARWYEDRAKIDKSYAAISREWMDVAASKGYPDAILRQARAYWTGEGARQDRVQARRLYKLAAEKGSEKAAAELAVREQKEQEVKARRLAKLAEQERKRTQQAEAKAHKRSGGFDYWLPLANSGDAEAMLRVGQAYIQGNGATMDANTGADWVIKAAAAGNVEAMYELAQLYSTGLGLAPNLQKAYEWYDRAANKGYPAAQYQLGIGYARGIGVERNDQKAQEWLSKASANGYSAATEILQNLKGMKSE